MAYWLEARLKCSVTYIENTPTRLDWQHGNYAVSDVLKRDLYLRDANRQQP